jgi:hypothetical protein
MNFRILGESLRPMADAVVKHFDDEIGIATFAEEEPIHPDVARPTLHAVTSDHHYLCIEFSETTPYPPTLDRFVLDCKTQCLPVRLYVAVVANSTDPNFQRDFNRARENGVGIIEVKEQTVRILHEPLSLSLAGLRKIPKQSFPKKYRLALAQAEATFKQGNPAKGCSQVYDEIEDLTRKIAKKTLKRKIWRSTRAGKPEPVFNLSKGNWATLIELLMVQLDPGLPPRIPKALWAKILGLTPHRNDTGHKPKSKAALIKRDTTLRTQFENAVDTLLELIEASRSLRI